MNEQKKFKVDVLEIERDCGPRLDIAHYFHSYAAAAAFRDSFNAENAFMTPSDVYWRANDPVEEN